MKISLIIPVFNEERVINTTIIKCIDFMSTKFYDFEIIAVDDGSFDGTNKLLQKYNGFIKIITLKNNMGKGFAVKMGIAASSGDFIFFTDADLSYDLSYIEKALPLLKSNDMVIGCRDNKRTGYSPIRKYPSLIFNDFANLFLKNHISDTQCGFKCFTKKSAEKVFERLTLKRFSFDFEVIYIAQKLGMTICMMDVCMKASNESKVNIIKDANNMIFDVIKVKVNDIRHKYE